MIAVADPEEDDAILGRDREVERDRRQRAGATGSRARERADVGDRGRSVTLTPSTVAVLTSISPPSGAEGEHGLDRRHLLAGAPRPWPRA